MVVKTVSPMRFKVSRGFPFGICDSLIRLNRIDESAAVGYAPLMPKPRRLPSVSDTSLGAVRVTREELAVYRRVAGGKGKLGPWVRRILGEELARLGVPAVGDEPAPDSPPEPPDTP